MATEYSVQLQDAAQVKANEYLAAISQYVQSINNDPSYVLHQEDIQAMIDQSLEFVRDNGLMSMPAKITAGTRFRTLIYNDIIDGTKIDIGVTFARIRALLKVINTTINVINANTYKVLSEVDEMLDKIANLSNLKNTFNQYDEVIHNTFIEDNNTYNDIGYKAHHNESGGIITLRDVLTDHIVEKENNFDLFVEPLNKTAVYHVHNKKATSDNMSDALDVSVYSRTPLFIKDFQVGFDETIQIDPGSGDEYRDVVSITYNGGAMATILRFPTVKFINHLAMKFAAAGLLDILGVYYSIETASNMSEFEWINIDFTVDTNNIRGADINFPTKEAGAIMVILGQKLVKDIVIESDKGLTSLVRKGEFNLAELTRTLEEKANVVNKGKIKEFAGADVVKTLSDETSQIINSLIITLEAMLPPEERPVDISEPNAFQRVEEYNFCIYDMQVDYIHYFSNSTFKSDIYGGDGSISDIMITSNGYEPSLDDADVSIDTTSNFYIEMENGQHRIAPNGLGKIKDIFTVEQAGSGQIFDLDILAKSTGNTKVYINSIEDTAFNKVQQYDGAPVVLGLQTNPNIELNFGDVVIAIYEPADLDTANKEYNPYELSVDKLLGNPALIYQDLTKGSLDKLLVKMDDTSLVSYSVPDQIYRALLPAQSEDEESIQGWSFASGVMKVVEGDLPDGWVAGENETTFIPDDAIRLPSKAIYNGIIEEEITVASGQTAFNTDYDYIPGTLHVATKGNPIAINEYELDTDGTKFTKTAFTTGSVEYEGPLLASYMPGNPDTVDTESNISSHNFYEFFHGTDNTGVIDLPFYPHVDMNIRQTSTGPGAEWKESRGKFVNKNNEEIVYEPIKVSINGKVVENVTDYISGNKAKLAEYNQQLKNYQYYVDGNKLVFNTIIKGQLINISFYKQNDRFRLVSKLYRTNRKTDDITPEVYGYSLYFNKRE